MTHDSTCPACGHVDATDAPLSDGVFACSECGARLAFGEVMPRVVIEPDGTGRFVVMRVGDNSVKLDPQLAAAVAINILSLVKP